MDLPEAGTPAFLAWKAGRPWPVIFADLYAAEFAKGIVSTHGPIPGMPWPRLLELLTDAAGYLRISDSPGRFVVEILPGPRARIVPPPPAGRGGR